MAKIMWQLGMAQPRIVSVKGKPSGLPKKPVMWIGELWVSVPEGEKCEIDRRSWRSNTPLTRQQAQTVLHQLLDQVIGEHGKDAAKDAGFWIQSR